MDLFPLTKDIQKFLLRVEASLGRIDSAVEEIKRAGKTVNDGLDEVRRIVIAVRAALKAS